METNTIELFSDQNEKDIHKLINDFFSENKVNDWKIIRLIEHVSKNLWIDNFETFQESFSAYFGNFWKDYSPPNKKAATKMDSLKKRFRNIIMSEAVKTLIEVNKKKQKQAKYGVVLDSSILDDKTGRLSENTEPSKEANSSDHASSSENTSSMSSKNKGKRPLRASVVVKASPPKKKRSVSIKDFQGLSNEEALSKLVTIYGKNGTLNLSISSLISNRLEKVVEGVLKSYKIQLPMAVHLSEKLILFRLANSKSKSELEKIANEIPTTNGNHMYMKLAITKLIALWNTSLLQATHRESWFRSNVYADLFDSVFMFDSHIYETKRSECHSSVVKALKRLNKLEKNAKDIKVDLLCYATRYGDIFSCEDKAGDANEGDVNDDLEKSLQMREKTLTYWRNILPLPSAITLVEAISAQFYGLNLTIYGSRILSDGKIVHYKKCEATIPSIFEKESSQAAHFMMVVISLRRTLLLNYKKLKCLASICEEDSVQFLTSNPSTVVYRQDSSESDEVLDSIDEDWEEAERIRRLNLKITEIKKMGFDEDVLTVDDWEELISV